MISFVYFDLGGVVIQDVNGTEKWTKMKRDIGIKAENDNVFDEFYSKYEKEVCIGRDVDTLIPVIADRFHIEFPAGYSLLRDFINRFCANESIWPVIDKIKQNCKVGFLTNTYPRMLSAILKKGIMPDVRWDIVIDSVTEKCQKPDIKIYELAQNRSGVDKDRILFIDNKKENIEAASDFGWKTFFYDSSNYESSSLKLLDYYTNLIVY